MVLLLSCLLSGLLWVQSLGQDYCRICPDHTMCLYEGIGESCTPRLAGGVSREEQREILEVHNSLRGRIGRGWERGHPPASDMLLMVWHEELALFAQRWADQCIYAHDQCRDLEDSPVGQNTRYTRSSRQDLSPEWNRTVTAWYSEVDLWRPQHIQPFRSVKGAGHFTQLVWAATNYVGCGFSAYPSGRRIQKLYVCNYAPRGNVQGRAMYRVGVPCSECPDGHACVGGLCSASPTLFAQDTPTGHSQASPTECARWEVLYNGQCLGLQDIVTTVADALSRMMSTATVDTNPLQELRAQTSEET